jgi:hypothetical protein
MNTAWPRRVSLIISGRLPTIPSPTIGVSSGVSPGCPTIRLNRLSPALQASSFTRRLAHPRRPNRVHRDDPPGPPMLRTGRSRSVAPHPALLRRSYGSIPHDSSPHGSGLPPLYLPAFSGARVRQSSAAAGFLFFTRLNIRTPNCVGRFCARDGRTPRRVSSADWQSAVSRSGTPPGPKNWIALDHQMACLPVRC